MGELRLGVAGLSGRGLHWIRLVQKLEGYRITALCDLRQEALDAGLEAVTDADGVACFQDYTEFANYDGIDAVALVVRSEHQGAMAAEALEAGKHVNAEVPAAHSMEECWRIVVAQERTGKVYQLAEQCRYAGYLDKWHALVHSGELGHVTYAEGQYLHYYTRCMFQDPHTSALFGPDRLPEFPDAQPAWTNRMPPIHYAVHDLSPLLRVLDDRVIEVIGMSTDGPSRAHPEILSPDMQVALMKTQKGAMLRLACSFAAPHPENDTHWQQVIGTKGCVEWRRAIEDTPRLWLANGEMHDKEPQTWGFAKDVEPEEAKGSGHWNLDFYVHAAFRDAVLHDVPLEFDVYKAMDVAAPSILAADSIDQDSRKLSVPDFRPNDSRRKGEAP